MRLVVTGGLGYVGSHLVDAFLAAGHQVATVDIATPGVRRELFRGEEFLQADLVRVGDWAAEAGFLRRADAVIHLAALIEAAESVRQPALYYEVNSVATLSALELARRLGAWGFVFASSAAVYGRDAPLPIREEAVLIPENPYGWSKMMGERIVADVSAASGMDCLSLRMFNLIGGELRVGVVPRGGGLFAAVTEAMAGRRRRVTVYGEAHATRDGTASRDYLDVRDAARAFLLALERRSWGHASINIGSGVATTVREVVEAARGVAGAEPVEIEAAPARPGELSQSQACVDKAAALLGWRPSPADLPAALDYELQVRRRL
jgi:UDP-glucose 4-epimerase